MAEHTSSRVPLLILSDSVTGTSGLGRIARELATRIHRDLADVFEVATCGMGGGYSQQLSFPNYPFTRINPQTITIPEELPTIWKDFAGDRRGVLFAIWNSSWLEWLANPSQLGDQHRQLREFLLSEPFERWAYLPQDGHCANFSLPESQGRTVAAFDRVLAYTKYGAQLMTRATAKHPNVRQLRPYHYLPHGLNTDMFYPRDRADARRHFAERIFTTLPANVPPFINPAAFMVGIVATNTPRKDWHLAFEVCSELLKRGRNIGIWAHTNMSRSFWDIPDLARIFNLHDRLLLTTSDLTDEQLAWSYAAMDCTLAIGSGEGWGIPIAESLACGVPCIHGDYAGGAELLPSDMLIKPLAFRGEGTYSIQRPVFSAHAWAARIEKVMVRKEPVTLPDYIAWDHAWPEWERWLREGVGR